MFTVSMQLENVTISITVPIGLVQTHCFLVFSVDSFVRLASFPAVKEGLETSRVCSGGEGKRIIINRFSPGRIKSAIFTSNSVTL